MPRVSSYDDGAVGGDSPTKLIRFPGEPAIPAATDLVHSLVFGETLVAKDVVDAASRRGEAVGWSFGKIVGFISGENVVEGGEGVDDEPAVPFPLVNLAPCFVTAATTPPPSLPFFLSFLEPGMNGNPEDGRAVSCPRRAKAGTRSAEVQVVAPADGTRS